MKYHITIKDNETGEIFIDADSACIIYSADIGEETMTGAHISCKPIDLYLTHEALKEELDSLENEHIEIGLIRRMCNHYKKENEIKGDEKHE